MVLASCCQLKTTRFFFQATSLPAPVSTSAAPLGTLFRPPVLSVVGICKVRIESNGLIKGDNGLLIAFQFIEDNALSVVGICKVRIESNGLIKGDNGLFIA